MQPSSQPSPTASLGVCYYPEHWAPEKWATDFNAMCDIGIRFVRIGEFAWSSLEPVEGRNWALFYSRGIALERSGQWPRAESDFLRALELQ